MTINAYTIPTMHLRFNRYNGQLRLQQRFDTTRFIEDKWVVTQSWQDVEINED